MRVFIGFREIAGICAGLRSGFDELGVRSTFLERDPHPFTYGTADDWKLMRWIRSAEEGARMARKRGGRLRYYLSAGWCGLLKRLLFVRAAFTHDVFVFLYRDSFSTSRPHAELKWLRRLGRKTVFIFVGSDIRPPYMDRSGFEDRDGHPIGTTVLLERTSQRRKAIAEIEREASLIIACPFYSQFLTRKAMNFHCLGIPSRIVAHEPRSDGDGDGDEAESNDLLRVLHAPSVPSIKGTALIRRTIERLKAGGVGVDYRELHGVPNDQVLGALRNCDLTIDQMYSDTPLAGFATEAAQAGKPSVVGGYGWDRIQSAIPERYLPPSIRCHPDELEEKLRWAEEHRDEVQRIGAKAKAFVNQHLSAKSTAERLLAAIQGDAGPDWFFDPRDVEYECGAGVRPFNIALMVDAMVDAGGSAVLGLEDKPRLRDGLLRMRDRFTSKSDTGKREDFEEAIRRIRMLEKRIAALEDEMNEKDDKLSNFRGMIERRDRTIEKLQRSRRR